MQGLKITVLGLIGAAAVVIDEQTKLRGLQKLYYLRHSLHCHLQIQNGPDSHDYSSRSGRISSLLGRRLRQPLQVEITLYKLQGIQTKKPPIGGFIF